MLVRDRSTRRRPCPHPVSLAAVWCVVGVLAVGALAAVNVVPRPVPAPVVQAQTAGPAAPGAPWQRGGTGNPFTWTPPTIAPPTPPVVDTPRTEPVRTYSTLVAAPAAAPRVETSPPVVRLPVAESVLSPPIVVSTVRAVVGHVDDPGQVVGDVDDATGHADDTHAVLRRVTGAPEWARRSDERDTRTERPVSSRAPVWTASPAVAEAPARSTAAAAELR